MNDLHRANQVLGQLMLDHQEGRLPQHEYRHRRRQLLQSLGSSAAITHRNAVPPQVDSDADAAGLAVALPGARHWRVMLLGAGALVMAVLASLLFGGYFDG